MKKQGSQLTLDRLVYPCGVLWAKVVSTRRFRVLSLSWTFNTGPFNIKEHAVITVCMSLLFQDSELIGHLR
jgi:hypothetical protein